MTTVTQIAGVVYLSDRPLTLREAESLWQEVGADFMSATNTHANYGDSDHAEIIRLSALENALRRAIHEAKRYRTAAGWRDDPHLADGPVDAAGAEWDRRKVGA